MAFNSLDYALFFIFVLVASWSLVRWASYRLFFLLAASVFSYMCSRKLYILLVLIPTVVDYLTALGIAASDDPRRRKLLLGISIALNLGLLGLFKYYDFFITNVATGLQSIGLVPANASLPVLNLALPVGISFYTFQTMAYVIDVYRGTWGPIKSFLNFSLVITFFPHFVAGPIVLAKELSPQFERPAELTWDRVSDGLFLIIKGLLKKTLADWLGSNFVDNVYKDPSQFTATEILLSTYAYSMQIYGDFSGYTDMALGSAKLLGYELPENFRRPYLAQSVAHFWRRWHMTLSRWVREYVYFPLGGTRKGQLRAYGNIMLTLVIMGLWHGANWTFFWYGVIHGAMVCVNRWSNQRRKAAGLEEEVEHTGLALLWRVFLTFQFVSLARILFRAENLAHAERVASRLVSGDFALVKISWTIYAVMAGAYLIHWLPPRLVDSTRVTFRHVPAFGKGVALAAACGIAAMVKGSNPVPFIYFAF